MEEKIKPITIDEVEKQFVEAIPDIIIKVVNNLIVKHWEPLNHKAVIKQDEILDEIIVLDETLTHSKVFNNHWLDIEPIYREIGWKVDYNKPPYYETWDAYFEFSKKK